MNTTPKVETFVLKELELAAYNPRDISDDAAQRLRASIKGFGLLALPVVNVADGKQRLVSGHQRVTQLIKEGYTKADCVVVEFDEATEIAANLTLNNPATQGTFDVAKSQKLLKRIAEAKTIPKGIGLKKLQQRLRKKVEDVAQYATTVECVTDSLEELEEIEIDSEIGKTYILGPHRIYCGAFQEGTPLLFPKGADAAALISDPLYNIASVTCENEGTEEFIQEGKKKLNTSEIEQFFTEYCKAIADSVDGACYVFIEQRHLHTFARCWRITGSYIAGWLFWVKAVSNTLSRSYHNKFEAILFGAPKGVALEHVDSGQTNIFEFGVRANQVNYAVLKPTALVTKFVLDSTEPGELVYDPCLGSGTTLLACEETERICYGCEVAPQQVDVIRRRWTQKVHGDDADWQELTVSA